MKYILKNIESFAKHYTKIFILLIITIAASTLIIHVSYGLFRQYRDRKELSRIAARQFELRLESSYEKTDSKIMHKGSETMLQSPEDLDNKTYGKKGNGRDVTVADLKRFCKGLDREIADRLLNIHAGVLQERYRFETDFLISDGEMINSPDYGFDSLYNYTDGHGTHNIFQYGRYFTDQEYANGEKVCIAYGHFNHPGGEYLEKHLVNDSNVMIGDEEYRIIGLQSGIGTGYIPITSVPEDSVLVDGIQMQFRDNISMREINLLIQTVQKYFDGRVICNYETEEAEDGSYLYNTILGLVVIVSMAAALNFCALYHYIITTRRRTLAIFRICGLTCRQCIRLYLGECTVLSVGTYLVTVCFFRYFLMPALAAKNNVFDFHYQPKVYLVLFLLYFVSSFLFQYVMIRWNLKKRSIRRSFAAS